MATQLAAPLDELAELCSTRWLEVARGFFQQHSALATQLSSPWQVSAAFTSPPPHLSADGAALGFTVTFTSTGITLAATINRSADWFQEADYNCALPLKWIIYGDNPGAARLQNEYEHLCGHRISEPVVGTAVPPAIGALMAQFHDHMARRTLNNPDLEHRAAGLGLSARLRELDEDGYTIMPGAFTSAYADALRAETAINHAGREDGASFRATMLLQRGRIWEEAATHPWVLTVVEYLLGRGCLKYQSDTIVQTAGQETHPGLHSDYSASRITEPFPEYCVEGTAVWALDDFHREHGPTCVLPGSVTKRRHVPPGTTQEGTRLLEMDEGSIAFWHGGLWHGSTPRTAAGKRSSLHNAYCRNFIRPLEDYSDIDATIVARNAPVFSALCGLVDAFGKSAHDGVDFSRLGFAATHGFATSNPPTPTKT